MEQYTGLGFYESAAIRGINCLPLYSKYRTATLIEYQAIEIAAKALQDQYVKACPTLADQWKSLTTDYLRTVDSTISVYKAKPGCSCGGNCVCIDPKNGCTAITGE
jgi:hypothetical protein